MVRQTGARWVRIWVRWDKAQLFPPSRLSWSRLDSTIYADATANSGLREARLGPALPRPVWNVFASFPAYR